MAFIKETYNWVMERVKQELAYQSSFGTIFHSLKLAIISI